MHSFFSDPFTMIEHQRRLKEQELADKKVQMEKVFHHSFLKDL